MNRRLLTHVAVAYLLALTLPVAANAATAKTPAKGWLHSAHTAKPAATQKVDLNSAPETAIAALPGIDATVAQKIISMRPYQNTNQIVAMGIVTKEEFTKIRNRVTARQSTLESKAANSKAPGSAEGITK